MKEFQVKFKKQKGECRNFLKILYLHFIFFLFLNEPHKIVDGLVQSSFDNCLWREIVPTETVTQDYTHYPHSDILALFTIGATTNLSFLETFIKKMRFLD